MISDATCVREDARGAKRRSPRSGTRVRIEHNLQAQPGLRDVNVTYGIRRALAADEFSLICGAVANVFTHVLPTDAAPSCAGGATSFYMIRIDGVQYERETFCGGRSSAAHAFAAA